jgi:hypothetical protein
VWLERTELVEVGIKGVVLKSDKIPSSFIGVTVLLSKGVEFHLGVGVCDILDCDPHIDWVLCEIFEVNRFTGTEEEFTVVEN